MKIENKIGFLAAILMTVAAAPALADGEDTSASAGTEGATTTEVTTAEVADTAPATVEPSSDSSHPATGSHQNGRGTLPHKLSKCRGVKPQGVPNSIQTLTQQGQIKCSGQSLGQNAPGQQAVSSRQQPVAPAPAETAAPAPAPTVTPAPVDAGSAS